MLSSCILHDNNAAVDKTTKHVGEIVTKFTLMLRGSNFMQINILINESDASLRPLTVHSLVSLFIIQASLRIL